MEQWCQGEKEPQTDCQWRVDEDYRSSTVIRAACHERKHMLEKEAYGPTSMTQSQHEMQVHSFQRVFLLVHLALFTLLGLIKVMLVLLALVTALFILITLTRACSDNLF